MRKILPVTCFIAASVFANASATSVYITRDGAGSKNGTTLANAGACDATPNTPQATCAFFNNVSNWGSGAAQIGAGTTVFVGGDSVTITATSGASSYFQFQGSGTSGNSITFMLQTVVTAPYWCCDLSGGAIDLNANSNIIIDGGGTPCGWNTATNTSEGTCVGSIQASSNGDGLTTSNSTTGIFGNSCVNVEVRNIGIYNLYVKSNVNLAPITDGISVYLSKAGAASNCSVHDSTIHDNDQMIVFAPSGTTNGPFNVYNNELYNMNQGIVEFAGSSTTIGAFNIYGNHIHDMALWDTNGLGYPYHHDGVYLTYPNGAQTITILKVYNNVFDGQAQGVNGGPTNLNCATSWFFLDGNDTITAGYFYNNVVMSTTACSTSGGGNPLLDWQMVTGTAYVYNNTFVCASSGAPPGGMILGEQSTTATTANVFNNLIVNCAPFSYLNGSAGTSSPPTTGYDYNVYATAPIGGAANPWYYRGGSVATLAAWQSAVGQDSHAAATTGSAGLGGSYENGSLSPLAGIVPQSGSIAKGAGTNLTTLCSSLPTLCPDITGTARPTGSTAWDAGALQFQAPPPPTTAPTGTFFAGNYILYGNGGIE